MKIFIMYLNYSQNNNDWITYFEFEMTSSFSFSHFLSSSPSVVFEILLFNNLVIIESRVFLKQEIMTFMGAIYIMAVKSSNENTTFHKVTHKNVRASSLTSSLLPSSASSPSVMISSQSFNLFTISSMRSAPQLSHGPAPVGQFS